MKRVCQLEIAAFLRCSIFTDCKPSQIWMLIRHGTRNPSKNEIKNMRHDLPDLQRSIIENHEKHGSE